MWVEITHPFRNFNATVEDWKLIRNFIPHFTGNYLYIFLGASNKLTARMLNLLSQKFQDYRVSRSRTSHTFSVPFYEDTVNIIAGAV